MGGGVEAARTVKPRPVGQAPAAGCFLATKVSDWKLGPVGQYNRSRTLLLRMSDRLLHGLKCTRPWVSTNLHETNPVSAGKPKAKIYNLA